MPHNSARPRTLREPFNAPRIVGKPATAPATKSGINTTRRSPSNKGSTKR